MSQHQTPNPSNDYHCDINCWNQALDQGFDPRTPDGVEWDGNSLLVAEIAAMFEDHEETPPVGTGGFGFWDSPDDDDEEPEHMFFYINSEESDGTYQVWDSNGILDQVEQTWSDAGLGVANSTFVPLNPLPAGEESP